MKSQIGAGRVEQSVPVLAPYEVFHNIYKYCNFRRNMLSDEVDLELYWWSYMQQPYGSVHPLYGKPHLWKHAIPIIWFVDAAEFSKSSNASAMIHEWSSAIVSGISCMDAKNLASLLVSDSLLSDTDLTLIDYFKWCHDIWEIGLFPYTDYYTNPWHVGSWRANMAGKHIAGPWIACFAGTTHDEMARKDTHRFRHYYKSSFICEADAACIHILGLSYCHFSLTTPGWRRARMDHDMYLRRWDPEDIRCQ